jgi:predicted ester cyclase
MGIPPTNKKLTIWTVEIDRFVGGKVVEAWERSDTLGMMQQLGVIPKPEK